MAKKQELKKHKANANANANGHTTADVAVPVAAHAEPTTPETNDELAPLAIATTSATPSAKKSEFLKLFWTLAESDVATRTSAAAQLLAYLQENGDDVQYTLKRLVRGLASSRDAARQGFSAALTALLVQFPSAITLRETLDLIKESMELTASMKPMEQREHMFGKLFGLLALQRTMRLASDDDVTVAVITELVAMAKWKKWLREACVEALLTVLSDVSKELFVAQVVAVLCTLLEGSEVAAFNADQVALAVGLQHYIQTHKIQKSELPTTESTAAFFHVVRRKHLHVLAEPLKHSTVSFPRVHGVWFGLFGHILHAGSDGALLDRELFQEAWTVLVENLLLAGATATHERKGLALKLFELVVPVLPSSVLRAVLTPNFVKCLFNNTLSKKTYLHDAARHTLKVFASSAPAEFFLFLQREFVKPMAVLVEINKDDADDAEELTKTIKAGGFDAIIAIEEERERELARLRKHATVRLWALEHMATELTEQLLSTATDSNKELRDRVLQFLTLHAFFAPSTGAKKTKPSKKTKTTVAVVEFDAPEPALSSQVRDAVIKKLFSLLSVKLTSAVDSTLSTVFASLVELLATGSSHELLVALDDEQRTLLASVEAHVASLRAKTTAEPTDDAFLLLFMSCALRLADASQRSDAQGVIADLEKCFVELETQKSKSKTSKSKSPAKKSPSKKAESETTSESESVDAVVVLTDLLLSLLSQDSSAMREIVTHVFKDLVPLLNAASLQTLVAAIAPAAPGDEEQEDDEAGEDEDEDMEGDDDEEEKEVVLSSAADIADALRTDANLAELHREDQTLSAIVGQVKTKAKAKKDAKKHRLHVLHFKLRVVDLLALYASAIHAKSSSAAPAATVTSTSNAVRLVLPLFESLAAIASSDVEQRVLKERLQSVLLHKFVQAQAKSDVASSTASALTADDRTHAITSLERVCELLSKKPLDKELVNKVGAAVVVHLIRSLVSVSDLATPTKITTKTLASVQAVVRAMAIEVFTKKHAKFPRVVFEELATKSPKLALHVLLPSLTEIASANGTSELVALDDFSKSEVFRLLTLLLKPKHVSDASERRVVDASRQTLMDALVALLQQKKQESDELSKGDDEELTTTDKKIKSSEMKAKRVKVFLSFALHLVRLWTSEQQAIAPVAALEPLVRVAQSLATSSPVVKSMVKQLTVAAGFPVPAVETTTATTDAAAVAKKATKSEKKTEIKKTTKTKKTDKTKKATKKTTTPTKRKRADADDGDDDA